MAKRLEEWKPIAGYEGYYEVSNFGNIRSVDRICGKMPRGADRHIKGQPIAPTDSGHKYLIVHLKKDGKRQMRYVHRLVAEAFCEKPPGCNVVNHIDYNVHNNHDTNLEWTTQAENIRHSKHRMCQPRAVVKTNTGEKYIYRTKYGTYRVNIKRVKVCKSFKTLADAVEFRNEVLNGIGITA